MHQPPGPLFADLANLADLFYRGDRGQQTRSAQRAVPPSATNRGVSEKLSQNERSTPRFGFERRRSAGGTHERSEWEGPASDVNGRTHNTRYPRDLPVPSSF